MKSKWKSKRVVFFLIFLIHVSGAAEYCQARTVNAMSDKIEGGMSAIRSLLLTSYDNSTVPPLTIGARKVASTPVEQGTLFASPDGSGQSCTLAAPCSIRTAFGRLQRGDVLFLRGGIYNTSYNLTPGSGGRFNNPIIIESYPEEKAILVGQYSSAEDVANNPDGRTSGIRLGRNHSYILLRNIEIQHMGWAGIAILGSHNIVEGCHTHNNMISGIVLNGGEWHEDHENYQIPYPHGYNIIRDNISNENSDVGLPGNGGNSDGIAISSGRYNTIINNTVYENSDDGIDTWRSNDSFVGFNLVYDNGRGNGDGNGIKAGGNLNPDATNGLRTIVKHNIVYDNKSRGLDYNAGHDVVFLYNTSFRNGTVGVQGVDNTLVEYNVASQNGSQNNSLGTNNSWNTPGEVVFVSINPHSSDFLKLAAGSPYSSMGAYTNLTSHQAKIFFVGDSTVHNWAVGEQGYGSSLEEYMINPDKIFNRARAGASTKSYRPDRPGTTRDWPGLLALINATDISEGAYLFIQFGHNDENEDNDSLFTLPGRGNEFYANLKGFIQEARELGLIPVLITPVERMYKNQHSHRTTHGDYPETIRLLAEDEQVLLLDLQAKSYDMFNDYADTEAIFNAFAFDDHTHFDPEGAKIVAGWLKELICSSSDHLLCSQFK